MQEGARGSLRPFVTSQVAEKVAIDLFGVAVATVTELPSYDDRNFHISTKDEENFVLKVSNLLETKEECEFMNGVMKTLHSAGICVQQPLASVNGNLVEVVAFESPDVSSQRDHAVRLLTYLPGCILDDHRVCVDATLLRDLGATVARVDRTLSRELPDLQPPDDMLWCLRSVPRLRDFVFAVQEAADRELMLSVIAEFEREVIPRIGSLTKGVIHGDPNDHNVLVQQRCGAAEEPVFEIVGMLDWQDTHKAPVVFDLAILCMYALACWKPNWKDLQPISVPTFCIEGFLLQWPLPHEELHLLPVLVLARFAQSLCLGTYSYNVLDSTNPYVLDNFDNEWKHFRELCTINRSVLLKEWTKLSIE